MTVLAGSAARITSPPFLDVDGETPVDCGTTPTVTCRREDGTLLAAPTITNPDPADGQYTAALDPTVHTTRVDLLTLTWTGTTALGLQVLSQQVEVVGGWYVTMPELRALDGLSSLTDFPAELLAELRDEWTGLVEKYTGISFVERYAVDQLVPGRPPQLKHRYPKTILDASRTYGGTTVQIPFDTWDVNQHGYIDVSMFTVPVLPSDFVTVRYTYVHPAGPSTDLRRAAKTYIRAKALEQGNRMGRDLLSQTDGSGLSQRWSLADWAAGRPTPYDDVNVALNAIGRDALVG